MPDLPVEIWLKVCALACVDDGTTGRVLSAVSRYVRAATWEYQYRAVAVHGPRQADRLLRALRNAPRTRHIRHLYLTDTRDYMSGLSCLVARPRRAAETAAMRGLLEVVSPTVETMAIVSHTSRRTFPCDHIDLDNLRFPNLTELTLRGCYSLPLQSRFGPKLARFHMSSDVLYSPFARLTPRFYPNLTHIRISRLEYAAYLEDILRTLCDMMGLREDTSQEEEALEDEHFPSVPARFVLVEPGPGYWTGSEGQPVLVNSNERELLAQTLKDIGSLVVLPPYLGQSREKEAAHAKAQWVDRLNGGPGCWPELSLSS